MHSLLQNLLEHIRCTLALLLDPGFDFRFAMGNQLLPELLGVLAQLISFQPSARANRGKQRIAALRWFEPLHQVVEHLGEAHRKQRIGIEAGLPSQ